MSSVQIFPAGNFDLKPQWHKPSAESQLTLRLSLSLFLFLMFSNMSKSHFLVWSEREHVCLLYVYDKETACGTLCACVCVGVMALTCAESLYGTEWSRIWRNLSGLGYCRKPSLSYLLLLFLLFLFILSFVFADCTAESVHVDCILEIFKSVIFSFKRQNTEIRCLNKVDRLDE